MKYFVMSDIHGFYNKMMETLNKAGFDPTNPEHTFVSLGDLMDRGPQPEECLRYVMSLDPERRILIYGNHEDLMEKAIARHGFLTHDLFNGTSQTAKVLTGEYDSLMACEAMKEHKLYNDYINECILYTETDKAIFTHGWIPCIRERQKSKQTYYDKYIYDPDWRAAKVEDFVQATWYNGMLAWYDGVREPGKTIFCGHWHTSWGHAHLHGYGEEFIDPKKPEEGQFECFDPFVDDGIIAVDACTAYSKKMNCVIWEE